MKATTYRTVVGTVPDPAPRVSIVTTIYDRVSCLVTCLQSVQRSLYRDFEQIVVSDAPGRKVEAQIVHVVQTDGDARVRYLACDTRSQDWGITPAAVGLQAARGEYVCFLSDDNAYLPTHLGPLVDLLDADPTLGFVYSSCRYAGRKILDTAPPEGGEIDLGQPLFRKSVLHDYETLPFTAMAWDWQLIHLLMSDGVAWRHHNAPTFLFHASKYAALTAVAG